VKSITKASTTIEESSARRFTGGGAQANSCELNITRIDGKRSLIPLAAPDQRRH